MYHVSPRDGELVMERVGALPHVPAQQLPDLAEVDVARDLLRAVLRVQVVLGKVEHEGGPRDVAVGGDVLAKGSGLLRADHVAIDKRDQPLETRL